MVIGLPATNIHRHIFLHEVGHIFFETKDLNGEYASLFWPEGKRKGFTSSYARHRGPVEDAAECYVETILKQRYCGKERLEWIRNRLSL